MSSPVVYKMNLANIRQTRKTALVKRLIVRTLLVLSDYKSKILFGVKTFSPKKV